MHYALIPLRFKLKYPGFKTNSVPADGFFQGHGAPVDPPAHIRNWLRWRFRSETAREANLQETSGLGDHCHLATLTVSCRAHRVTAAPRHLDSATVRFR